MSALVVDIDRAGTALCSSAQQRRDSHETVTREGWMRVDRRFLYIGLFLMVIGAVLVVADLGAVDTAVLTEIARLWPLALVAIGTGIVLRRSQLSLPGGMLAAAIPGLVLGGALAIAPRVAGDCGVDAAPTTVAAEQGSFEGPATVSVTKACGSITVHTAPGNGWRLTGNTAGTSSMVRASARSLSIGTEGADGRQFFDHREEAWDLTLPTDQIERLSVKALAADSDLDLAGARIGTLAVTADVSEIVVDASSASIASLSGTVNIGSLKIQLPADTDLTGSLRVGGGELWICPPPGTGLQITTTSGPKTLLVDGIEQDGSNWESADFASAAHRSDLSIHANFAYIHIDTTATGACS